MGFDLAGFSKLAFNTKAVLRDFPLQVENYDLAANPPTIQGIDLSTGAEQRRVRVFLRPMREGGTSKRAEVVHFATDPYEGLSDEELRNPQRMADIANTVEAKCHTRPGGVLMVQSAFDDKTIGAVSAYWINRLAAEGQDIDTQVVVLTPVLSRLSKPSFPESSENRTPYFCCDVLHPEKSVEVSTLTDFNEQIRMLLAVSTSKAPSKMLVAIRLVKMETGEASTLVLDRRAEKLDGGGYRDESPDATIERFWSSMSSAYSEGLVQAIESRQLRVVLVPGTRYRFVGRALESLANPPKKRLSLNWERFMLTGVNDTGWMRCTVGLRRHKAAPGQAGSDEDFFPVGVWVCSNEEQPQTLNGLEF